MHFCNVLSTFPPSNTAATLIELDSSIQYTTLHTDVFLTMFSLGLNKNVCFKTVMRRGSFSSLLSSSSSQTRACFQHPKYNGSHSFIILLSCPNYIEVEKNALLSLHNNHWFPIVFFNKSVHAVSFLNTPQNSRSASFCGQILTKNRLGDHKQFPL